MPYNYGNYYGNGNWNGGNYNNMNGMNQYSRRMSLYRKGQWTLISSPS